MSLKMTPFKSLCAVLHSVIIMALSCTISEIKRDIGQKSRFFILSHSTPLLRGPRRNTAIPFGTEKHGSSAVADRLRDASCH